MKKLLIVTILCYSLLGGSMVNAKKPMDFLCDNREDIIRFVSEDREMMLQVDYIMHRESKCKQLAFNSKDPNGGSYGLFQINGYWCQPSKYSKLGWLQEKKVLKTCTDLWDPIINAKAFMVMYDYAGWQPWGGKPWI